jgi:hypothetical protein
MNGKLLSSFLIILMITILSNCVGKKEFVRPQSIGTWVVYWDGERGLKELETYGRLFDRVSLFAYELGAEGQPQAAPGIESMIPRFLQLAKERGFSAWVTLVNDWRDPDRICLKETEKLRRLLSDKELRRKHISEIVDLVTRDGFSGLDLDFEGFSTLDQSSLDPMITELASELRKKGLGFQVVVEPRKDRYLPPPGSVSIVVMGYNLHGPHSDPGPRATPDFLRTLTPRGKGDALGEPSLAIALGGFSWGKNQKVKQLDWETGNREVERAVEKGRGPGDVPYARLEDGEIIWFEDEKSLKAKWMASTDGFKALMLWRLGGNDDRLFRWLEKMKK